MPNTITDVNLMATKNRVIKYITIQSDGSEETDYSVYDSSAIATLVGDTDPLDCTIESIYFSASAASTARARLEWDATTDVLALDLPVLAPTHIDFRRCMPIGGLPNQGGSGKTGDINLTTTGLESGDSITLVMEIRRD